MRRGQPPPRTLPAARRGATGRSKIRRGCARVAWLTAATCREEARAAAPGDSSRECPHAPAASAGAAALGLSSTRDAARAAPLPFVDLGAGRSSADRSRGEDLALSSATPWPDEGGRQPLQSGAARRQGGGVSNPLRILATKAADSKKSWTAPRDRRAPGPPGTPNRRGGRTDTHRGPRALERGARGRLRPAPGRGSTRRAPEARGPRTRTTFRAGAPPDASARRPHVPGERGEGPEKAVASWQPRLVLAVSVLSHSPFSPILPNWPRELPGPKSTRS